MLRAAHMARFARLAAFLLLCLLQASPAWAGCGAPTTPAEFFDCAALSDPVLLAAKAELTALRASSRSAGLWQNPELSGDLVSGAEGANKFSASWMQSLPLSGERGLAAKESALRVDAAEHQFNALTQQRRGEWVKQLVRLRQIDEELELLGQQEGLSERALDRLAKLPYQTAEQQAASQTFKWSQKALEVTRLQLLSEQAELRQHLSSALQEQPASWGFLVPHKLEWPVFPAEGLAASPELLALQQEALAGAAGADKASASAWPELTLGPVVESESGGGSYFAGGALGLQLPLWDRKTAEKASTKAQAAWAETRLATSTKTMQRELELLRTRYETAVPALTRNVHTVEDGIPSLKAINNAYLAGRLPVSAALEAFRQYFDAVELNHALERETFATLWRAYALTGSALTRKP